MSKHHDVLIVGAGTGGIMTAAQLKRKNPSLNVAIVDPSKDHYYQPAWTLVGAGAFDFKATRRDMASVIPKGVTWIQDFVTTFDPDNNALNTKNSGTLTYDYLVVSPGLQMDLDGIEGLRETRSYSQIHAANAMLVRIETSQILAKGF